LFADHAATAPGKAQQSENPYQSPTFHEPVIKSTASGRRYGRIDPRAASRGKRFVGAMVDGIAVVVPMLLFMAMVGPQNEDSLLMAGLAVVLAISLFQAVLVSLYGKSLGKFLMGTTIVKDADVPGLISNIPLVGGIFSLVNPLYIFGEEKRCLHDLIAGTKVLDDQLVRIYQQREENAVGNYGPNYLS
jgi:uncharacterized RDD family membrane protein YckC